MAATVALIGLAHPHSSMYLDTLDVLDAVGGIVLYDPDPAARQAFAARSAKVIAASGDLVATLARPDVTHTVVAVPTAESPALLGAAIEAGKAIFTEKPGALSTAAFAPVRAALARRPVPFTIAYLNRWNPALRRLRDLYRQGAIGRLLAIELRMVTTQVRFRDPQHWLFRRAVAGGGIVSWLGCHWLDLARYLTGEEFTTVAAQLAATNEEPIDVEDTAVVSFRLSGGALGSLHAGYLLASGAAGYEGTSYDMAVHLRGTLGTLTFRRGDGGEALELASVAPAWRGAPPPAIPASPPTRGYGGAAGLDFFRAFLAARSGEPTPADADDAQRLIEILDAIYQSAASGRTVSLER